MSERGRRGPPAWLSPLCLGLALAMLLAFFAMLAVDRPQPSVELHAARAAGDEEFAGLLDAQLEGRRTARTVLTVSLLAGAVALTVAAFTWMGSAERRG